VTGSSEALPAGRPARAGELQTLHAEWVKLRTVRSTTWSLLVLASVSVLFTALATSESHTEGGSPGHPGDNDIVLDSLAGIWFGQIAVAVLAVLAITSEYSTRSIRTTFAANPRRRVVLAAKTAVVATIALVAGSPSTSRRTRSWPPGSRSSRRSSVRTASRSAPGRVSASSPPTLP
jgi:hypothetical protein